MTELLEDPNPHYDGVLLWWATIADVLFGNAYWLKVRSAARRVVEVYWVPAALIEPMWPDDGSAFISHYEYTVNGQVHRLAPSEVVHFRYGLDPENVRKGLSPLGSLLRELYTDDEAASFSASILSNLGIPGFVVSPDTENGTILQEEAERIKAEMEQKFSSDNRGRTAVFGSKVKAQVLSFSPDQMKLRELRFLPEERVTAVLGIPAIVVGLGSGLARSTFSNFAEAREAAFEQNVIPMQRLLAGSLRKQLLPDFEADYRRFVVDFDLSQVRVLQEDQNALHERIREDVKAGLLTVNQGRLALGMDEEPDGNVWLVPNTVTVTRAGELDAAPEEPEPREEPAALAAITELDQAGRRLLAPRGSQAARDEEAA